MLRDNHTLPAFHAKHISKFWLPVRQGTCIPLIRTVGHGLDIWGRGGPGSRRSWSCWKWDQQSQCPPLHTMLTPSIWRDLCTFNSSAHQLLRARNNTQVSPRCHQCGMALPWWPGSRILFLMGGSWMIPTRNATFRQDKCSIAGPCQTPRPHSRRVLTNFKFSKTFKIDCLSSPLDLISYFWLQIKPVLVLTWSYTS